jgi:hypothetical protein
VDRSTRDGVGDGVDLRHNTSFFGSNRVAALGSRFERDAGT